MSDCGACTGEINIKLCHDHTTILEQNLAEVDDMVDNLGVSMARLDKGAAGVGGGGPTGSKPPINLDVMDRHDQIRAVLGGWATALEGSNIFHRVSTKEIASYLFTRIDEIRTVEWAYELLDELAEAMNAGRMATDRAADKISLGRCQAVFEGIRCPDDVTAIQGQAFARCRTCGTSVNVREHQEAMIGQAWHVVASLPKLYRALRAGGHLPGVPLKRLEKWVERGNLVPAGKNLYTAAAILAAYKAAEQYKAEMAEIIRGKKLAKVA